MSIQTGLNQWSCTSNHINRPSHIRNQDTLIRMSSYHSFSDICITKPPHGRQLTSKNIQPEEISLNLVQDQSKTFTKPSIIAMRHLTPNKTPFVAYHHSNKVSDPS